MDFLEFTSILQGYYFTFNGEQIFNYILFHKKINPYKLMSGQTKYVKHKRID